MEYERRCIKSEMSDVNMERLDLLASNRKFTKHLSISIAPLRTMPIKEVTKRIQLNWYKAKELDKDYTHKQLAHAGPPAPRAIGLDEI